MTPRYHLAVLADIHGNLPPLEAVLADLTRFGPVDAYLVAGDVLTGPRQAEALRRLCGLDTVMILGNHERAILQLEDGSAPEYMYTAAQFSFYRWGWRHLDPGQLGLLRSLPEQRVVELPGAPPIRMTHGSPRRINESTYPETVGELFPLFPEPVLICAHTHQPWQVREDGRLAINPGAVTGSQVGRAEATYAMLDWDGQSWLATFHAVPYDLDLLRHDFADSGLLNTGPLARAFLINTFTASSGPALAFYNHALRLAEEAGYAGMPYIPDDAWQRAGETFDWSAW